MTSRPLTAEEFAAQLGISYKAVLRGIRVGKYRSINVCNGQHRRIYRIPAREAQRWIDGSAA